MDSDNFFGFDTSIPAEDNDEDGELDDDEYDALNDETFGSAAVVGDWEENHKQLSSLTEAERMRTSAERDLRNLNSRQNINHHLEELHSKENFRKAVGDLALRNDKRRLYERSVGSSPLTDLHKDNISSSPGNSIWSPTLGLEQVKNLGQFNQQIVGNASLLSNSYPTHSIRNNPPQQYKPMGVQTLQDFNLGSKLSSVKTVSEIEEELRHQHVLKRVQQQQLQHQHQQQQQYQQNFSKYSNDLERELSRQLHIQKPNCLQTSNSYLGIRGGGPPSNTGNIHSAISHPLMNNHDNYPNIHSQFQHSSMNFKSLNNMPNSLHYTHPLMTNIPNKMLPPGFVNNASNIFNRHPFNPPLNQRPPTLNRGGIFQSGGNMGGRIMNRNNMERKNFSQNNIYDQMRNNQDQRENNGQCGNRIRRDSDAEWEDWQRIRQKDEYAGLITPSEKSWLRNIQAMQLQTANPYQDDYYYVMYNVKKENREEDLRSDGTQRLLQENLMYNVKHQRKREDEVVLDDLQVLLRDKGKEGKEYKPPRLENSLGKLQVASVNAPRKIIDLQVVHLDPSHPTTTLQRDMRKHRNLLLHIEKLYQKQIELDDLERKINALPDCPTRDLFKSKCRNLVNILWSDLINPHESFVQLLCIRKGKRLVVRLLNWVAEPEMEHFLATLIQNLSIITKKDLVDQVIPSFWSYADRFFSHCSSSTLVSFGIMMNPQLKDKQWNFPALTSKLGLSMVLSLFVGGEKHLSDLANDESWQEFLNKTAHSLVFGEEKNKDIMPLPSTTLSASAHVPANHLSKCLRLDPAIMKRALEILKSFNVYLTKTLPSNFHASSSLNFPNISEQKTQTTERAQSDPQFLFCNSESNKTPKPVIEIF